MSSIVAGWNRRSAAAEGSESPRATTLHRLAAFAAPAWTFARSIYGWVPITPLGILVIAGLLYTIRRFTGSNTDLIIGAVCVGGLVICAMDVLIVIAAAIWFRFWQRPGTADDSLTLDVGTRCETGFGFGWASLIPLISIDVRWASPVGVETDLIAVRGGLREVVRPNKRGRADAITREITIRDWFGIARIRFRRRASLAVHLLPGAGKAAAFELIEQYRPGDTLGHPEGQPMGDYIEMRRYAPGDPLKLVLWKAYARTGNLLVRTPERAVTPTNRMLAYFVPGDSDEASAGIARAAVEAGTLGNEVIFMAEGAHDPAGSPGEAVDQIIRSVDHQASAGSGLDRFLVRGEEAGTSAAFLFVPPVAGAWLDRVVETLAAHDGPFQAVIGVDDVEPAREASSWWRLLFHPKTDRAVSVGNLRAVADRLDAAGVLVRIINRNTGESVELSAVA